MYSDLPYGKIEVGAPADLVLIDLEQRTRNRSTTFVSKGKNTPFDGWTCTGWPVITIFGGKVVWEEDNDEKKNAYFRRRYNI